MTRNAYTVAPRCSSNPHCMILSVDSPEAVARLADVLPALAASGGYRGSVYSNGKLVDEGNDLLDFTSCASETLDWRGGTWEAWVWHEADEWQRIHVQIRTVYTSNGWELRTTTDCSSAGYMVGSVKTSRPMGGKSYKPKRPNVRRETAKAVANYLSVVCSPEAVAERAARREEKEQRAAAQLEHQVQRALVMAPMVGSTKTEAELRAWIADELEARGGNKRRLADALAAHLAERVEELDQVQRHTWELANRELAEDSHR